MGVGTRCQKWPRALCFSLSLSFPFSPAQDIHEKKIDGQYRQAFLSSLLFSLSFSWIAGMEATWSNSWVFEWSGGLLLFLLFLLFLFSFFFLFGKQPQTVLGVGDLLATALSCFLSLCFLSAGSCPSRQSGPSSSRVFYLLNTEQMDILGPLPFLFFLSFPFSFS